MKASTGMSGTFGMGEGRTATRFVTGLGASSSSTAEPGAASAGRGVAMSRDGRFTALFEGRLANRQSLRSQLADKGYELQTGEDAEIALAWFERDGVVAFDKLDGPFALAIHDQRDEELFLVRDRAGQMPIHYHVDGQHFRFASDLRSVVQAASSSLPMCTQALEAYLQFTYIPAPWTIHEGVFKLLPGTYLRVGKDGVSEPQRYWDIDYSEANLVRDHARCKQILRDALFASVEDSLQTAGHVGALLSGGIDSTIITGIASRVSGRTIDTFTMRFDDRLHDESPRARLSADLFKTNHRVLTLSYQAVAPELDSMLSNLDQPYADSSYLPASMVSKFAAGHVDAVLTGDAGDELFAGYSKYLIGHYAGAFNRIPAWMSGPAVGAVNRFLPVQSPMRRKVNKVVGAAQLTPFEQRERLMCQGFPPEQVGKVLARQSTGDVRRLIRGYYETRACSVDEMTQAMYLDFKVVLEGDMFPKGYYAGRFSGLRTVMPMLDRRVIETAAQIPSEFKIENGALKKILKETFADFIPPALLKAPKTGFDMPIGTWLRGELSPDIQRELSEDRVRDGGVFAYEEVERLLGEHLSSRVDHGYKLWALYVFQKWQEMQ